ncbi:MAG: hypothetical protein HFJ49_02550 [Clostridia bacterium]|nr:hypothetical protein [Clostridia bacterium]
MQFIKWTSLILIFLLVTLLGSIIAKKYKNRVKQLKELKVVLNIIETKIKFTQQPLTEIFKEIANSEKNNKSVNMIFKETVKNMQEECFEQVWNKAILSTKSKLDLTDEDINIIEGMGKTLGTTDIEGQVKEIEIIKEFIDSQIEKAEEERKKNEKMYKMLGGIAGIGIVIILT